MIDTIYSNPKAIKHDDLAKMISNELMHYGVKGMHWGVRRYQPYPDGTSRITKAVLGEKGQYPLAASVYQPASKKDLKDAGKAIGNYSKEGAKAVGKSFTTKVRKDKNGNPVSGAMQVSKDIKNVTDSASSLLDNIDQAKKRKAGDQYDYSEIKKMSDEELRRRINRINMERQYASMTQREVVSGEQKAREVLQDVGEVVSIVGGIASTVMVVKSLMNK